MNAAVPRARDTKPSVTASPRMIAPMVTPLHPSTNPSIASRRGSPFPTARRNATSTASPKASAMYTVPSPPVSRAARYGMIATPSSVPMGTRKSASPER